MLISEGCLFNFVAQGVLGTYSEEGAHLRKHGTVKPVLSSLKQSPSPKIKVSIFSKVILYSKWLIMAYSSVVYHFFIIPLICGTCIKQSNCIKWSPAIPFG